MLGVGQSLLFCCNWGEAEELGGQLPLVFKLKEALPYSAALQFRKLAKQTSNQACASILFAFFN